MDRVLYADRMGRGTLAEAIDRADERMTADEIERRTRPARMSDAARASARQHPYFVDLYTGWDDHDPLTVGFLMYVPAWKLIGG